jgi:hypothetical protein
MGRLDRSDLVQIDLDEVRMTTAGMWCLYALS